jgi:hypothetical protein
LDHRCRQRRSKTFSYPPGKKIFRNNYCFFAVETEVGLRCLTLRVKGFKLLFDQTMAAFACWLPVSLVPEQTPVTLRRYYVVCAERLCDTPYGATPQA